ncbi:GNAT family N-acetyltransferase [Echinimonas agarilytica]|uniref:N-acetyltransferase n=1 Tax=Echinimonas agarilytica TaxID=1215918 RepID=A0AA42B8X1_9GAMM|nr:GNAT family N-acetyltransferase [Echinimonas agarilytica]MCM2680636.1 N-acetyltransferase [Echinimonas agarilytica]
MPDTIAVQLELSEYSGRFYISDSAEMKFDVVEPATFVVTHTGVSLVHRGEGYAQTLFEALIAYAKEHEIKIESRCSFIDKMFERHPELSRLWSK